tara:strand:+ start:661 stop:1011 length:351 start_codon:yes stop_codon:yes gene_type:complete
MQPLIHKASVNLAANKLPSGVSLNDAVILCLKDDGRITAILTLPSRLPFGIGKPRKIALGTLEQHATNLIKPALEKSAYLRVRIVEIETAHLSHGGKNRLHISVWGDPMALHISLI